MTNWQELEQKYLMQTARRLPLTAVRGQGVRLWDDQGKDYLDFVGGWAANILGHCHPVVVEAIARQSRTLIHTSNQVYTLPQIQLAELLAQHTPFTRFFFCNSGAEANEGAVKLARKWGKLNRRGAFEVVSALNSFHGRTLAMTAATGTIRYQEPFTPLPQGFTNVEYNSIEAISTVYGSQNLAILLEPIQGEAGVIIPDDDYLKKVRAWCDEKGLLLILDEIQSGMGRTGTFLAYQQFGVQPDIVTLAKGLAGGLPVGVFMAKEELNVFTHGDHGTTFGGNPLSCAVACAVLRYLFQEDLPARAREMGQHFLAGLKQLKERHESIKEVRGRGLLIAVEFQKNWGDRMARACLELGLLANPVRPNAIRFMPPLIVSREEIDQALAILGRALEQVEASQ